MVVWTFATALAVALIAAVPSPVRAEADSPRAALEDWAEQTRRMLDALQGAAQPWTDALAAYLASPQAYHPPETLPNGDIVIRRRVTEPDAGDPPDAAPSDEPSAPLNL